MREKILNLPSISDILKEHGFFTKKNLGQNFIFDLNVTNKIVRYAEPIQDNIVVEIGGGAGSLTRSILLSNPKKLYVIEKDERCLPILQQLVEIADGKLEIINEDALNFDFRLLGKNLKVIANLPYNIGTELLFKWYNNINIFDSLTLMYQKEVAERICANTNDEQYSRISVISYILCKCEKLFDVPPSVFFPQPKVYSSVISLKPHEKPLYDADIPKMKKVVKQAFLMRRKTIKNAVEPIFNDKAEEILKAANIDLKKRPEEISPEEYVRISRALN